MFEFDPEKSTINLAKHGIDFIQAQALWDDDRRAEILSGGSEEKRWLLIGKIGGRHWTAIYTMRKANIRIISVRRSRANEVSDYDSCEENQH
jgi:uncharacterized protein